MHLNARIIRLGRFGVQVPLHMSTAACASRGPMGRDQVRELSREEIGKRRTLYSPSRPMRGNQAVLPTPQVRHGPSRPHPSNQGVGTGLGSIWDAGNPDRA